MMKLDRPLTVSEFGLHIEIIEMIPESGEVQPEICVKTTNDNRPVRRQVPLPLGWEDRRCICCGSFQLIGAVITESADEFDPNILCIDCLNWWD